MLVPGLLSKIAMTFKETEEGKCLKGEKNLRISRNKLLDTLFKINVEYESTFIIEEKILQNNGVIKEIRDCYIIPDWNEFLKSIYSFAEIYNNRNEDY